MAQKSFKKYIFLLFAGAVIFVLGSFGGLLIDRYVVPKLAAMRALDNIGIFKKLTERVTVINKTEQIVVREDDSAEKIVSQSATAVVNIVERANEASVVKKDAVSATGVLLTNDGLIMTYSEKPFKNDNQSFSILLFDGSSQGASFVGYDPLTNLVFFRLKSAVNTPAIALANSDDARVGKKLIAIGSAFADSQNRLAVGILGNYNRTFNLSGKTVSSSEKWEGVYEMDIYGMERFVGGPVVGNNGEMVGVVGTLVIDNITRAFLIPSNAVRDSLERVTNGTLLERSVLGAYYLPITKTLALSLGLPRDRGALIYSASGRTSLALIADSPAMRSGLLFGDIIVSVNDREITSDTPLPKVLSRFNRGDTIELVILRNHEERKIPITL